LTEQLMTHVLIHTTTDPNLLSREDSLRHSVSKPCCPDAAGSMTTIGPFCCWKQFAVGDGLFR